MTRDELIQRQCDHMATGTQNREFLLGDDGEEPFLREILRLNLEQFYDFVVAETGAPGLRDALSSINDPVKAAIDELTGIANSHPKARSALEYCIGQFSVIDIDIRTTERLAASSYLRGHAEEALDSAARAALFWAAEHIESGDHLAQETLPKKEG